MRHLALLFLAFSWDQPVMSSRWKLASAQECFMGLCMFRWNMLQCVLLCLCVWVGVCWGRRRGAGHSQRGSWRLPNTTWILNSGRYVHMAVDIVLSLGLTLHRLATYRLPINDGYWTPPSFLCCHSTLHLLAPYLLAALELTTASQIMSATVGKSPVVWGIVLLEKKWKTRKSEGHVLNQTTILRNSLINSAFCQTLFHLPSELSALMTTSTWKLFT